VCDDERGEVTHIKKTLEEYLRNRGYNDVNIRGFTDPYVFEQEAVHFNLIFLDIEMGSENGLDIAKRLRRDNIFAPIVYITCYLRYAYEAYTVHPFAYLTKPFHPSDIKQVLDDYFDKCIETTKRPIVFKGIEHPVLLTPDDIYYFIYVAKRDIIAVTRNGRFNLRETLSEVFAKVSEYGFFVPNREVVINLKYIRKTQDELTLFMVDDSRIEISRSKRKSFYEQLSLNTFTIRKNQV
jgi:two-component system LytT family response regulator